MKLVEFPLTNLQDIPAKLRQFADRIEDGTLVDIDAAVLLLRDEHGDVLVHGFGNADPSLAYWMMGRGMRKLDGESQ
ncbi:hypothetical protein E2553_00190 [Paraburkholderia dipogonis]|uniref:Uncharacterized protein n=1 Tax=Paraburkholderia dipogonis TaxID=1211383 RepID=A0A4Y8N1J1_9BURK|nr:hypothetical protein [Paraburkholderia dipogonis]TFE43589.1 hypothetical protein E2553_00190 [Paraburkholderia dipogonis]